MILEPVAAFAAFEAHRPFIDVFYAPLLALELVLAGPWVDPIIVEIDAGVSTCVGIFTCRKSARASTRLIEGGVSDIAQVADSMNVPHLAFGMSVSIEKSDGPSPLGALNTSVAKLLMIDASNVTVWRRVVLWLAQAVRCNLIEYIVSGVIMKCCRNMTSHCCSSPLSVVVVWLMYRAIHVLSRLAKPSGVSACLRLQV